MKPRREGMSSPKVTNASRAVDLNKPVTSRAARRALGMTNAHRPVRFWQGQTVGRRLVLVASPSAPKRVSGGRTR